MFQTIKVKDFLTLAILSPGSFLFFPGLKWPIRMAGSMKGDESYQIAVYALPLQVPFQPWVLLPSYALKRLISETKAAANTQMPQSV